MHYSRLRAGKELGGVDPLYNLHRSSDNPLKTTWQNMRNRCSNPRAHNYKYYGAKGVKVCKRWDNLANFIKEMGERPEGTTLDRIDPTGDYSPDNCRWADWATQRHNRRGSNG